MIYMTIHYPQEGFKIDIEKPESAREIDALVVRLMMGKKLKMTLPQNDGSLGKEATLREIATHFQIKVSTIRRWIDTGRLKGELRGRGQNKKYWIKVSDVTKLIKEDG